MKNSHHLSGNCSSQHREGQSPSPKRLHSPTPRRTVTISRETAPHGTAKDSHHLSRDCTRRRHEEQSPSLERLHSPTPRRTVTISRETAPHGTAKDSHHLSGDCSSRRREEQSPSPKRLHLLLTNKLGKQDSDPTHQSHQIVTPFFAI